jgi:hypothetical protein
MAAELDDRAADRSRAAESRNRTVAARCDDLYATVGE